MPRKKKHVVSSAGGRELPAGRRALSRWWWWAGLAFLVLSIAASGALVGKHFDPAGSLPGCGEGSACGSLEKHPMGTLGGMVSSASKLLAGDPVGEVPWEDQWWPVSFLGLAWFCGLTVAWLLGAFARGGLHAGLAWLVRLGALGSVAYLVVIVLGVVRDGAGVCPYCVAAHAGSLGLLVMTEIGMSLGRMRVSRGGARAGFGMQGVVAGVVVAGIASGVLAVEEGPRRDRVRAEMREASAEADAALVAKVQADRQAAERAQEQTNPFGPQGFRGRYVEGPREAQARIVAISCYQCKFCGTVEKQIQGILRDHPEVSFSAIQFPVSNICNRYIATNKHPNGCYAAYAAEAAGMFGGEQAFWEMHHWLFDRGGGFTASELDVKLAEMGLPTGEAFKQFMLSPGVKQKIEHDVEIARSLGLHQTPMIFINGVELKPRAWQRFNGVRNAVERLLAQNPPALDHRNDAPPMATEKYVSDWRDAPARSTPVVDDASPRALGPEDAEIVVRVVGSLLDQNTALLDRFARELVEQDDDVRYIFHNFPTDRTCNPRLPDTERFAPKGCWPSRYCEAAFVTQGQDAYWKLHGYIAEHWSEGKVWSRAELSRASAELGLDAGVIENALQSPEVSRALEGDIEAGWAAGVERLPWVFLNEKEMNLQYDREWQEVVGRVIEEARSE